MKFLVLTYQYFPFDKPTSKLVNKILSSPVFDNVYFDVISLGSFGGPKNITKNIINIPIFDYDSCEKHFIKKYLYKLKRKLYSKFNIWGLYDKRRFYLCSKYLLKTKKDYDGIISFSGVPCTHYASYKISKKFHLPLFLYYSDPFISNNVLKKHNQKYLYKLENKWIKQSINIFMPQNYLSEYLLFFNDFKNKMISCELPGFFTNNELSSINKQSENPKYVTYAGSFFPKFREPFRFIELAKNNPTYAFFVLGDLKKSDFNISSLPNNIEVLGRLKESKYFEFLGRSKFLYLEDNSFPNQVPYKTFEYVSTGKYILFSTSNIKSDTSIFLEKYPLLIKVNNNLKLNVEPFAESNQKIDSYYNKYQTDYIADIMFKNIMKYYDKGLKNI